MSEAVLEAGLTHVSLVEYLESRSILAPKRITLSDLVTVLEQHLPDGVVATQGIDRLSVRKYVGPWCLAQLHELHDQGCCTYLTVLRQRAQNKSMCMSTPEWPMAYGAP